MLFRIFVLLKKYANTSQRINFILVIQSVLFLTLNMEHAADESYTHQMSRHVRGHSPKGICGCYRITIYSYLEMSSCPVLTALNWFRETITFLTHRCLCKHSGLFLQIARAFSTQSLNLINPARNQEYRLNYVGAFKSHRVQKGMLTWQNYMQQ